MSSINPLTGEAGQCITVAGPDGVNKVEPSKFSPQSQRPLVQTPKRPLRPPPPDSSYETVSIQVPGKFTVVLEKPFVNDNPECVQDGIDLVCLINRSKKPGKFSVPRKSNTPDKPERTEAHYEQRKVRRK